MSPSYPPSRDLAPIVFGLLLASQLTGCARAPQKGESTTPSQAQAPLVDPSPPESAESLSAPDTSVDEAREAPAKSDAGASAPMKEEKAEDHEGSPLPAPGTRATQKDAALSLPKRLKVEVTAFRKQLNPEELSCEGAAPIREAICAIAKRICTMDDLGSHSEIEQCQEAKKSCADATSRLKEKCG